MTTIGMDGKQYTRESARIAKDLKWDALIPRKLGSKTIVGILPGSFGLDIPTLYTKGLASADQLVLFSESRGDLSWTARRFAIAQKINGATQVYGLISETINVAADSGIRINIFDFDSCGILGPTGIDNEIKAILTSGILTRKARIAVTFSRRDSSLAKKLKFVHESHSAQSSEINQEKRVKYLSNLIGRYVNGYNLIESHCYFSRKEHIKRGNVWSGGSSMAHCVFNIAF